ncbi:MAG TPA: uracil-DNA glycosylase [Phototrophicaceae bacterium]|nr:uracil-DNA glycosylase [Phototrophicaceae bacterium]
MADERIEALEKIAADVKVCKLCDLWKGRTHAVPGAGNYHAEIMFIGEGPGFNEDKQGLPFVGQSGKYLETLLKLINLKREDVFITNVVKCRPPENRDPLPIEITTCKPYLDGQSDLIDPLVIVTLGRFSMARYFPGGKITQIHGQPKFENGHAYIPLFHPAAVLRSRDLEPKMEADFKRIPEILAKVKQMRGSGGSGGQKPPSAPAEDAPPKQLSLF